MRFFALTFIYSLSPIAPGARAGERAVAGAAVPGVSSAVSRSDVSAVAAVAAVGPLAGSGSGSASEPPTFADQLESALTGTEYNSRGAGFEAAIDAALGAHFDGIDEEYSQEAVDRSVVSLEVDYVGPGSVEHPRTSDRLSIEILTRGTYRERYEVVVDSHGRVGTPTLVAREGGVRALRRLFRPNADARARILAEIRARSESTGACPYDLQLPLATIVPADPSARLALARGFLGRASVPWLASVDLFAPRMQFAFELLTIARSAGLWERGRAATVARLNDALVDAYRFDSIGGEFSPAIVKSARSLSGKVGSSVVASTKVASTKVASTKVASTKVASTKLTVTNRTVRQNAIRVPARVSDRRPASAQEKP